MNFGAIAVPRKIVCHPPLNEVIVGINKLIRPQLTIVDGIVALGRSPVKMGLIMTSEDQLALDYVAAEIVGFNPARIRHLALAEGEGVGRVKNIEIVGEKDVREFSKKFPHQNIFLSNFKWNQKLRLLDFYLKVTKDTRPPVLDK